MDPAEFRLAVSRFTTGVTVVTSIDGEGDIVGMTANSFTSISLSPPTVLVSVMKGRTLDAIQHSGRFGINILPATAVDVSQHFAGRQIAGFEPEFEDLGDMPKLKGVIAFLDCRISRMLEVADHTLLVGSVGGCIQEEGGDPLVFYSSQYRALGN